ncbi:KAP family NTPase [Vibrio coralliirubri]|uniref:KAP family NTPase n=1 Tax=Vibrio coralliirubri TaxID=1516159 RepID=UPI0021C434EA|nr:KAP family NTPase [Vibrio coralliirubri]
MKDINNVSKQVESLLLEKAFPSVVLLDGKWGAGKTYFIKNNLEQDLAELCNRNELRFEYLSLYGIADKNEFKNLILSVAFSNNEKSSGIIESVTGGLGGLAKAFGDKGATSGILNSISGIVKQELYNKANNLLLVLDDIERVEEGVAKNILAECLHLVERDSSNIMVILVSNGEKISLNDDIEKVISNKVHFSLSIDEIVKIARRPFDESHNFNNIDFHSIVSGCISKYNFYNLRIIKRTIFQFEKIYNFAVLRKNEHFDIVLGEIFEKILCINIAHYERGIAAHEVIDALESNDRKGDLLGVYLYPRDKELVDYCYNMNSNVKELVENLKMPSKKHKLASFVYSDNRTSLPEDEFIESILLLENTLKTGVTDNFSLNDWLVSASLYLELVEGDYIDCNLNSLTVDAKKYNYETLDLLSKETNVDFELLVFECRLGSSIIKNKELKLLLDEVREKHESKNKNESLNENIKEFLDSWSNVRDNVIDGLRRHKDLEYTVETMVLGLEKWSNPDVCSFSEFILQYYRGKAENVLRLPELIPDIDLHSEVEEFKRKVNPFITKLELMINSNDMSKLKLQNIKSLQTKLESIVNETALLRN